MKSIYRAFSPGQCDMHVHVASDDPFDDGWGTDAFIMEVLDTVTTIGYKIGSMSFTDELCGKLQSLHDPNSALIRSLRGLRCLHLNFVPHDDTTSAAAVQPEMIALRNFLEAENDLERMSIMNNINSSLSAGFTKDLMLANRLDRLRVLVLVSIALPSFETLYTVLDRCGPTLESLLFCLCSIGAFNPLGVGYAKDFLRYVRTKLPRLNRARLSAIKLQSSSQELYVCMPATHDPRIPGYLSIEGRDKTGIELSIDEALNSGLCLLDEQAMTEI
jgi:hypothetical protein